MKVVQISAAVPSSGITLLSTSHTDNVQPQQPCRMTSQADHRVNSDGYRNLYLISTRQSCSQGLHRGHYCKHVEFFICCVPRTQTQPW